MIRRRAFLGTGAASLAFGGGQAVADIGIPGVPPAPLAAIEQLRGEAVAAMARGHIAAAIAASTQALDAGEALIRSQRLHINESDMHDLLAWLAYDADAIYTLAAASPDRTGSAELALRCAMARKGRITRELFFAQSFWARQDSAKQPAVVAELQVARRRFTAAVAGQSATGMETAAQEIISLEDALNASRQSLLNVPFPAPDDVLLDMGVDNLVVRLNFGLTMIVYVEYNSVPAIGGQGGACYLGIVAEEGPPAALVPLGTAAQIEPAAQNFANEGAEPSSNPAISGQLLAPLIFAPLTARFTASNLNYSRSLLISPDGILFRVPFSALPDESGALLFDRYPIRMLDSPLRASIIGARSNSNNGTNFVAFANPDLPIDQIANGLAKLPRAELEAENVAALWPGSERQIFTGAGATPDELIRQAPQAGVLHIACHGELAFSPTAPYSGNTIGELNSTAQPTNGATSELIAPSMVDAALSRSLLLLAPSADAPGYFSALEAAGLDLGQTQLVCLSACNTGIGDYERGEGIYGLRSAFLAAGAETVVSVLWEADDAVTETLMVTYYQLMFQGNSRADALRNAMAAIKQTHPHPFYWAGFVFSGVDSLLRLPAVNSSSW